MPQWKSYESSVRLISAILAAHPELKLNYQLMSDCFGGDCTKSALENRFRVIKTDAKRIRDAVAKKIDPMTLDLGGLKEIAHYYKDATPSALDHRFRPIKKLAIAMREGKDSGIAEQYGENVTAKAVSTRFERLKKEPSTVGNSSTIPKSSNPNSTAGAATPVKRPYTKRAPAGAPKKRTKKEGSEDEVDEQEEGEMEMPELNDESEDSGDEVGGDDGEDGDESFAVKKSTPKTPKKGAINRTVGGRVTKTPTSGARKNGNGNGKAVVANPANAIVLDDDDEDDQDLPATVEGMLAHGNGNGNIVKSEMARNGLGTGNGVAQHYQQNGQNGYDAGFNGNGNGNGFYNAAASSYASSSFANGNGNGHVNGNGAMNGVDDADMEDSFEPAHEYQDEFGGGAAGEEERYMSEGDEVVV